MTKLVKTSFDGATREGIEDIRRAIQDAATAAKTNLETVVAENGEKLINLVLPSERAYEVDWEICAKYRKGRIGKLKADIAANSVITIVGLVVSYWMASVWREITPDGYAANVITGIGTVLALLGVGAVLSGLQTFEKQKKKGFVSWFVEMMPERIDTAWAISEDAVYAIRKVSEENPGLVDIARVSFDEIQACVHFTENGTRCTRLYTRQGERFLIPEPHSHDISGAQSLAHHIWQLARPNALEALPA